MKKLIAICGPTASGKSKLGVLLSKALDGEVVSVDSMQLYRGMDIGTAKPDWEEQEGIPHHMLSVAEPWENYSVARYVEMATACVEDIYARGKQPILVGGTGLYLNALCQGLHFAEESPNHVLRKQLQKQVEKDGITPLLARLREVDPDSAARIPPGDVKRILRALEVFENTGRTITQHNEETKQRPWRYERCLIGLNYEHREDLRVRINQRVDGMMAAGLVEEVDKLLLEGIAPTATAMQAIGYKELIRAKEEGRAVETAVEEIKLRSRQYAKRQLSWFRREKDIHWILWGKEPDFSSALQNSILYVKEKA